MSKLERSFEILRFEPESSIVMKGLTGMSKMCFVEQGERGIAKDGGSGRRREIMSLNLTWLRNKSSSLQWQVRT